MSNEEEAMLGGGKKAKKKCKIMDGFFEKVFRPCIVELMATALFVCMGCMVVQNPLGANIPLPSAVAVALCHGLIATSLITAFGNVSGAHFNPAVTLAVLICGEIKPFLAICYIVSQLIGGIVGAFLSRAMMSAETYRAIAGGAHILTAVDPGTGIVCELMLTAVIIFTVLHSFFNDRPKNEQILGPIAVGFAIVTSLLAGIQVTGGSMNPARSLGPAVALVGITSDAWPHHYVYWIGPMTGSVVATVFFKLCSADEGKRWLPRKKKQQAGAAAGTLDDGKK